MNMHDADLTEEGYSSVIQDRQAVRPVPGYALLARSQPPSSSIAPSNDRRWARMFQAIDDADSATYDVLEMGKNWDD
jgi:hypothetical protein